MQIPVDEKGIILRWNRNVIRKRVIDKVGYSIQEITKSFHWILHYVKIQNNPWIRLKNRFDLLKKFQATKSDMGNGLSGDFQLRLKATFG